jgi:hypothetical protein
MCADAISHRARWTSKTLTPQPDASRIVVTPIEDDDGEPIEEVPLAVTERRTRGVPKELIARVT